MKPPENSACEREAKIGKRRQVRLDVAQLGSIETDHRDFWLSPFWHRRDSPFLSPQQTSSASLIEWPLPGNVRFRWHPQNSVKMGAARKSPRRIQPAKLELYSGASTDLA